MFEGYTLQVLPPQLRPAAVRQIARCPRAGGGLLVITRARGEAEDAGEMPWPLTREEMGAFVAAGLRDVSLEDYMDDEDPPVRRFRACYRAALPARA